jgi:hypothetical protein
MAMTGQTSPPTSRPSFFDMQGRAKWDAWSSSAAIDTEDAKRRYEAIARRLGWSAGTSDGDARSPVASGAKGNVSVSVMAADADTGPRCVASAALHCDECDAQHRSELHELVADDDLAEFEAAFARSPSADVNMKDAYVWSACRQKVTES